MHAPVAAKLFNYFDCRQITETHVFLVRDYSLQCGVDAHQAFLPVVVLFVIGFAIGLPLALSVVLFINRKRLHTPRVMKKYGFLYDRFRKGTEGWEVFETSRKLMLTGAILFMPPTLGAPVALVFSIIACCLLSIHCILVHS